MSGVVALGDICIQSGPDFTRGYDFSNRIKRFFDLYKQGDGAPIPFGGRDAALEELDTWLADPRAPPRLLLAAPAGRGKSALLVAWTDRLRSASVARPHDLDIVFVPVSIRFETSRPVVERNGYAVGSVGIG
jgi:hypothetical protein